MKIAQFQDNARPQLKIVFAEGDCSASLPMFTRISEWVEVDFPQLSPDDYRPQQIRGLDLEEQNLRRQLGKIAELRANLQPPDQPDC